MLNSKEDSEEMLFVSNRSHDEEQPDRPDTRQSNSVSISRPSTAQDWLLHS